MSKVQLLECIENAIRKEGRPLSVNEILKLTEGDFRTRSRTPQNIIHKHLSLEVKNNAASRFVRVAPGKYGLRHDEN